jgi:transposase InsO family protein
VWRGLSSNVTAWARWCLACQQGKIHRHKALTFTWISCFGVPETITSNRGPQFTSNLWFKLCEMFHIFHKQTTAYHPESNGAVKRLHRCLKDALRTCTAVAT